MLLYVVDGNGFVVLSHTEMIHMISVFNYIMDEAHVVKFYMCDDLHESSCIFLFLRFTERIVRQ